MSGVEDSSKYIELKKAIERVDTGGEEFVPDGTVEVGLHKGCYEGHLGFFGKACCYELCEGGGT